MPAEAALDWHRTSAFNDLTSHVCLFCLGSRQAFPAFSPPRSLRLLWFLSSLVTDEGRGRFGGARDTVRAGHRGAFPSRPHRDAPAVTSRADPAPATAASPPRPPVAAAPSAGRARARSRRLRRAASRSLPHRRGARRQRHSERVQHERDQRVVPAQRHQLHHPGVADKAVRGVVGLLVQAA